MKPLKTKLQKTGYVLGIALSAFALGTFLQFAKAWSEPTVAPPNAEIGAPINTSANYQNKSGAIGSDTGFATSGSISAAGAVQGGTELCIGSDCRTAWPTGGGAGDNMGNEIATTDLNMNGHTIYNAINVDAQGVNAYQYLWTPGPAYAGTYYDVNNENYYVIPSGTSIMNQVDANAIRFSDGTTQTTAAKLGVGSSVPASTTCNGHTLTPANENSTDTGSTIAMDGGSSIPGIVLYNNKIQIPYVSSGFDGPNGDYGCGNVAYDVAFYDGTGFSSCQLVQYDTTCPQ